MRQLLSSAILGVAGAAHAGVTDYPAFTPDGATFNFHVYTPENTTETLPVIFFVSGVGGTVPVALYSDLLEQIAYKGYVVVGLGHLEFPDYPKEGQDLYNLLEWAGQGGLATEFLTQQITAVPDVANRASLMAQSAGNHVAGQSLFVGCSIIKAVVMIDPVDGLDPAGMITDENLIIPGEKLPYNLPAIQLDNHLDPVPDKFGVPCSPWFLSGPRWFDAMAGPVWNFNSTKYGHLDCLNDFRPKLEPFVGLMCPSKPLWVSNDPYRKMLADTVGIFLGALFEDRPDDFALLENSKHYGVQGEARYNLKGFAHDQIKPGCTHTGTRTAGLAISV